MLRNGGMIIDTSGLRSIGVYDADDGLAKVFAEIAELTTQCHFVDCVHETEPDCAVLAAVDDGALTPRRLASWRKLQREAGDAAAVVTCDVPDYVGGNVDLTIHAPTYSGTASWAAPNGELVAQIPALPGHHPRRKALGALLVVALALVVAFTIVAAQAERVHRRYGTLALRPGTHTPVIPFHGRNYDRDGPMRSLPSGVEQVGSAPSNGDVFRAPSLFPGETPTVLYIRYPDGTVFAYSLSGGP